MRPKRWKALMRQVQSLGLDLEDHQELMKEHSRDFDTLVRKALGLPSIDADAPAEFDPSQAGLVPAGEAPPSASAPTDAAPDGQEPRRTMDSEEFQATEESGDTPESMRRLWRAIASATHPDRTGGDPELDEAYKRASEAWTKRQFETLLDVAMDLGITLPEPDEVMKQAMIRRAERVTQAIRNIEATALWTWIECEDEKRKADIVRQVAEHVRKTRK